jgi:hypothetical protein
MTEFSSDVNVERVLKSSYHSVNVNILSGTFLGRWGGVVEGES